MKTTKRTPGLSVRGLLFERLSGPHAARTRLLTKAISVEKVIADRFGFRSVKKWKLKQVLWYLSRHCQPLSPATRYAHWLAVRAILEALGRKEWLVQLSRGAWVRPTGEKRKLSDTGRPRRRIR